MSPILKYQQTDINFFFPKLYLGRLTFSLVDGLSPSDPNKIERPHFFGGRGISVFRASDMAQVWDSNDLIERVQAELFPSVFNGNTKPEDPDEVTPEDLMDKRSDNHVSC